MNLSIRYHFARTVECDAGNHAICNEQAICWEDHCRKNREHSCACECHVYVVALNKILRRVD